MPSLPPGWYSDVAIRSAGGASFSGDFLVTSRSLTDDRLDLALVDVSGKGVEAGPKSLLLSGAFSALLQPMGAQIPGRETANGLIRADMMFLAVELALIGLLVANLATSSASHAAALSLVSSGTWAWLLWGGVVVAGVLVPLALQALELTHRIPHTLLPALLVLAGGFALRWVMVGAGQASHMVSAASALP